jgi:polyisoprenoid-binding protein YceI
VSTIDTTSTSLPTGTWRSDPVHSTVDFSIKHMVVSSFRGSVPAFEATLVADEQGARLEGVAQVASIVAQDPNLTGHLQSPDFFDGERHPELRFSSVELTRDGDELRGRGELTVKGITRPVEVRGEISGPASDPWGGERIGVELHATVDRREFDLNWNAPLPTGGLVLSNDVKITARLELVKG